ncbi:MAG: NAD-dependent epimerase/dehydratase family protein [Polyangiaceae bacterium]|nr:NAD-dependent epimerase/dehydratase family protein [Polyangiaceae bacterium]
MRVAVTGGTGHIGGNLIRSLLEGGHKVRVLVRERADALDGLAVERIRGDVCVPESLRELFAGVDLAYHLAARVSVDGDQGGLVQRVNVDGTRNVVAAALAARVRRLVHASSIHAYATAPGTPIVEGGPKARGRRHPAYDRSKALAEEQVQRGIERGLDAVIVNPTGVIGRHDLQPSRMGEFFRLLCERHLPMLVEGGFDWVDVRDVVSSMLTAADRGRRGESYILSGTYATVRELATIATAVTGVPAPRWQAPQWLARLGAPFALMAAHTLRREPLFTPESLRALRAEPRVTHDRAAAELGHCPRPLRATIEDVYRSFRRRGVIPTDAPLTFTLEPTDEP